jgi:hypothetical protein
VRDHVVLDEYHLSIEAAAETSSARSSRAAATSSLS